MKQYLAKRNNLSHLCVNTAAKHLISLVKYKSAYSLLLNFKKNFQMNVEYGFVSLVKSIR